MLCLFFRVPYTAPKLLVLGFLLCLWAKRGKEKKTQNFFIVQQIHPA
jgi:hypothetical protein